MNVSGVARVKIDPARFLLVLPVCYDCWLIGSVNGHRTTRAFNDTG